MREVDKIVPIWLRRSTLGRYVPETGVAPPKSKYTRLVRHEHSGKQARGYI